MQRRLLPYCIVVLALVTLCVPPLSAWDTSPYLMGTWAPEFSPHLTSYFIGNPTTKPLDVYGIFSGQLGTYGPLRACYKYTIPANGTWYLTDLYSEWRGSNGPGTAKFFAFPVGTTTFDPNAVIGGFQQEIVPPEAQTMQLLYQDFETDWPPANWTVTDDVVDSPVVWHRSDQPPNYGANLGDPISGYHAYAESWPAYEGSTYDTSLVSPPFNTVGMDSVELRFDYQYWVYQTDHLDLEYSIDGGASWVTLENLASNGGYAAQSHTVDISVTRGNPSVQLRWRYYNLGYGYDWWTNIDNIQVIGTIQLGQCKVVDMNLIAVTINSATIGEFTWLNDRLKTNGCPTWPFILSQNFASGDGGFSVVDTGVVDNPWVYSVPSGTWLTNGNPNSGCGFMGGPSSSELISPLIPVLNAGILTLSFDHRYSFEYDGTRWDGGQVQMSVNGSSFVPVLNFSQNGYDGIINPGPGSILDGQPGFNGDSTGYFSPSYIRSIADLGFFSAGDTLQIKFLGGWDWCTRGSSPNWQIQQIQIVNSTPPSAPQPVPGMSFCPAPTLFRVIVLPGPLT
jgi:hypothetical protein